MNNKKSQNENFNIPLKDLIKYFFKSLRYTFYTLIFIFLFFWILWASTEFITNKFSVDNSESEIENPDSHSESEDESESVSDNSLEENIKEKKKKSLSSNISFSSLNSEEKLHSTDINEESKENDN